MSVYKDSSPTKDGRTWRFKVYYLSQGENIPYASIKYKSKKEAQEAEAKFILTHKHPEKKNFHIVALLLLDELYQTRKDSTALTYERDYNKNIKPFFEKYDIGKINTQLINQWKIEMQKKEFKVSYLNKLYNIMNLVFKFAMRNFEIKENPVAVVGRFQSKKDKIITDQQKLRYITYQQFQTFISFVTEYVWKVFFIFLYYTGMRKGEVQALRWKDIDFEHQEIIVDKTLTDKTKHIMKLKFSTRTAGDPNIAVNPVKAYNVKCNITSTKNCENRKVKMSAFLLKITKEYKLYMMQYIDFSEEWFVFGGPRFLPSNTINRKNQKYFSISGVNRITIHEFRHSHVSLLVNEYLKSGQTDTEKFFIMMASRMGHTIQVMLKTYLHFFPTIQNEIVSLLDNL